MNHAYVTVQWNPRKKVYDRYLWLGIFLYLALFVVLSFTIQGDQSPLSPMIVLMRAFATCAFLMLNIVLLIGPLARLNKKFLPLLYNRRHFGVSLFFIALIHALLAIVWYHGFGVINPLVSVFTSDGSFDGANSTASWIAYFPFQPLGAVALLCLFLLAATSHDFWNANLGATLWKAIHMCVYPAYGLIVAHIALGALQTDSTGMLPMIVFSSVIVVGGLHVAAAIKTMQQDRAIVAKEWVDVGCWQDIPNNRAIVVTVGADERAAIFRYNETKIAAVSNVCQHQNGPLGEGKVIKGCITCPWHGFQYRPEDGCSPAPFSEKIATYEVRMDGDRILLNPTPLPQGTARPVVEVNAVELRVKEIIANV